MKYGKPIILKEYEPTKLGVLNPKDIFEIDKINNLAKTEIFEIKANNIIKAKQYVGIVKVNNKNIQVLPKIFGENNDSIIKNLLYMLSYTKKLKIKESDIAHLGQIQDLFEIFIYIFAKELLELLRKDFKKNYNLIEENSSFLKGKLLFSQHIKNNLFNKSKFFVEYEKMDENILLNIFLNSVCNKLIKITNSKSNFKLLSKCVFILKDIDTKIFKSVNQLNNLKFNKQNKEYKEVFGLAKLLYFGNSPDFSSNLEDNFSILFDMNVLFEEFIAEFIKKNENEFGIKSITSQSTSKYVFNNNKFLLKPDIILDFESNTRLIIDTKYKKICNESSINYGVSSNDIYQMFVYGMRYFEVTQNEKNIVLLYPLYEQAVNTIYNSEENIKIYIKTINLNFDLSIKEGRNNLIDELKEIIIK
ncbi:MAG: hypothetical protein PHS49_06305 [Candidatus Gracilibacteria bacterium]|nr:hypothetical protein [Candidatus Gracilibacteria bacterium]